VRPTACRVENFDTSRFRIAIGLQTNTDKRYVVSLTAAPETGEGGHRVGELDRGAAGRNRGRLWERPLAAIERALFTGGAPQSRRGGWSIASTCSETTGLLAGAFMVLALGTCAILVREAAGKGCRHTPREL